MLLSFCGKAHPEGTLESDEKSLCLDGDFLHACNLSRVADALSGILQGSFGKSSVMRCCFGLNGFCVTVFVVVFVVVVFVLRCFGRCAYCPAIFWVGGCKGAKPPCFCVLRPFWRIRYLRIVFYQERRFSFCVVFVVC